MTCFSFKLAAIDIDDTLVGPDKRVSPANRLAISRLTSLGCRVVLASGRRHANMLPFYRDLGLTGYVVSCHGAVAKHARTGEVIHQELIRGADAAAAVNDGLARGLTVMHWSARGIFAQERTRWVERYQDDCGGDPVAVTDLRAAGIAGEPAEKVIWGAEPALIPSLARVARERYRGRMTVTVTDDWFLEFTAPAASKAAGVAAVTAHYGLEPREVLAFGDGNNDVPVLSWAGLGVAMSHARPAAQSAANFVAPAGGPDSSLARAVAGVLAAAGVD